MCQTSEKLFLQLSCGLDEMSKATFTDRIMVEFSREHSPPNKRVGAEHFCQISGTNRMSSTETTACKRNADNSTNTFDASLQLVKEQNF